MVRSPMSGSSSGVTIHGPKTSGMRKVLARGELVGMMLPVAHAAVVIARISRDVLEGAIARNIPAGPADDKGQLPFIIKVGRDMRANNVSQVPGLRVGESGEDRRVGHFGSTGFLPVRFIVQSDAEYFVGVGNHREPAYALQGIARRRAADPLRLLVSALCNQRL